MKIDIRILHTSVK